MTVTSIKRVRPNKLEYEDNSDLLADSYTKRIYLRRAVESLQKAESWLHRFCDATSINDYPGTDVTLNITSLRCMQDELEHKRSLLKEKGDT